MRINNILRCGVGAAVLLSLVFYIWVERPKLGVASRAFDLPAYGHLLSDLGVKSPIAFRYSPVSKRLDAFASSTRADFENYVTTSGADVVHYTRGINEREFSLPNDMRPPPGEVFVARKSVGPERRRLLLVVYHPSEQPLVGVVYIYLL